jgi:hypothetical protein
VSHYLCLQRNLPGGGDQQRPSPAQMQEMYAKFATWQAKFKGNLKDLGGKLGAGTFVGPAQAQDGPFVEVKDLVGGYMIIEADNLDEAQTVARECPGLVGPGSGVEIIEIHRP